MQISIASNFLNAFLDVIFVWVFHWGVAGSAISTAGSRFFSMSIVSVCYTHLDVYKRQTQDLVTY